MAKAKQHLLNQSWSIHTIAHCTSIRMKATCQGTDDFSDTLMKRLGVYIMWKNEKGHIFVFSCTKEQ